MLGYAIANPAYKLRQVCERGCWYLPKKLANSKIGDKNARFHFINPAYELNIYYLGYQAIPYPFDVIYLAVDKFSDTLLD